MKYNYPIIEVKNLEDLKDQIKNLPEVSLGYQRLYRGQNKDYDGTMIPSFYRDNSMYDEVDYSWKVAGLEIIQDEILSLKPTFETVLIPHSQNIPIDALVQHYGSRSTGLDVTSNLDIALWFATHQRIEKKVTEPLNLFLEKPTVKNFIFNKVTYPEHKLDFCYLYIFECKIWDEKNDPEDGNCVDLNKWYAPFKSRPNKQKAWYIYSTEYSTPHGELKGFIKMAFMLPRNLTSEFHNLNNKKTTHYFPKPSDDSLYSRLLKSYFFEYENEICKRSLNISQYYDTVEELMSPNINDSYIKSMSWTPFPNYFQSFCQKYPQDKFPIIECSEKIFKIIEADLFKMEIPDFRHFMVAGNKDGSYYFPSLKDIQVHDELNGYNMFIELANSELVAGKNPLDPVLRGIWFVHYQKSLHIQLHYIGVKGFLFEKIISFSLKDDTLKIDEKFMMDNNKDYYDRTLLNCARVIQTYSNIKYFLDYKPFVLTYGDLIT